MSPAVNRSLIHGLHFPPVVPPFLFALHRSSSPRLNPARASFFRRMREIEIVGCSPVESRGNHAHGMDFT